MSKIYERWEVDFIDQRLRQGKDVGHITYAEAIEFGARRQHLTDRRRMVHNPTDDNLTKEEMAHQLYGAKVEKKMLIEKAVKWLNDNKVRDDIVGYFLDTQREEMREEFIEEFKKAMEE